MPAASPPAEQESPMTEIERHTFDVVVIGAGGAGLRAAIEARLQGKTRRDRLQVAVRQGAHRDGRGRHRRGHGKRQLQGQLAGPFPRHDARRQVPQPLADGRAARQGSARPGVGARDLRRAVRPHAGRQDQPAQLRRARVPAACPRRRPHRPRDDPHAAAEDRVAAAGRPAGAARRRGDDQGLRRDDHHVAAQGRRTASPAPSATPARTAPSSSSRRPRSCSPPAASASRSR